MSAATLSWPELPPGARPRWPAWSGFAAMGVGTIAVTIAAIPLLPVALFIGVDGVPGALALLVLIVVQDAAFVGTAFGFASLKGAPRRWHFGLRATPALRTVLITLAAAGAVLGFELGYYELVDVDEGELDESGGVAFALAAIVVAPVAEELFFRSFMYRSLRNRLRVWSACLVDAAVFTSVHVQYLLEPELLVVIAVFAIVACLVYEATGSVFAPIAMHAAFNTLATVGTDAGYAAPLAVGAAVLLACVIVALRLGPAPSPFPPEQR